GRLGGFRAAQVAPLLEGVPQVVLGQRTLPVEGDRGSEFGDGAIQVALEYQDVPQVVVSQDRLGAPEVGHLEKGNRTSSRAPFLNSPWDRVSAVIARACSELG